MRLLCPLKKDRLLLWGAGGVDKVVILGKLLRYEQKTPLRGYPHQKSRPNA